MSSFIMFMMSLYMGNQIQSPRIDHVHHDVQTVAALADGMLYYQNNAIEKCWANGASRCPAGHIALTNRFGSSADMAYGSGYETSTDGSTYIVTTLDRHGVSSGRTVQNSNINAGIFAALKSMTTKSSSVGYYDQTAGGVVLPDNQNQVVSVTFQKPPVQGQPVLYTSIATAPPPVQIASIDGGGYSPLVPIPPTVIPVPVSPAAIISPPASVSPPEPMSPTYTPPATVVVNPISPWAPSPVPPPPPPPPPPPSAPTQIPSWNGENCWVVISSTINNDSGSSGLRMMLRCGSAQSWLGSGSPYIGPEIVSEVVAFGVGNDWTKLSIPSAWVKHYGINAYAVSSVPDTSTYNDDGSLLFYQITPGDFVPGSFITYLPIDPVQLYLQGKSIWNFTGADTHYENSNQTYNMNSLIVRPEGVSNVICFDMIHDTGTRGFYQAGNAEYEADAPYPCSND